MLLDPEELQLLYKLWMLPSDDEEQTWAYCDEEASGTVESLKEKGFIQERAGQFKITERGEMRLLDPFTLMVEELHDR